MVSEKKDHVKIGKELGLFIQSDVVGRGLPLLTPKGATIKRVLRRFIEDEEIRRGYQFTETPVLAKSELYKISGHLSHYRDSMFVFNVDDLSTSSGQREMVLRPMTCPHQFMIYKSQPHSYKELPIKYAEIATLFRKEQTGEMHGLLRAWQFTLVDAHTICLSEQLEDEFGKVLELIQYVMKSLGFKDYWYRLGDRDEKKEKYIDNPTAWKNSLEAMKRILDKMKMDYIEAKGEAAFYGPKLDIQMRNVYGKEDTMFTVQIDFALPERFDMNYEGADGKKHRPMIIHSSSIGALERVIAMLIEQHQGAFPVWLSPVQAVILPVSEKINDYGEKVLRELKENDIRAEIDLSNETLGKKILEAKKQKAPYLLVVGEKEEKEGAVSVNARDGKKEVLKINDFVEKLKKETRDKC